MALVTVNLNKADIGRGHVQRTHQAAAFAGGEQPITIEGRHKKPGPGPAKGLCQITFMISRQIEEIHGARDRQV